MKDTRTETWLIWDSDQIVSGVHAAQTCSGPCVIHGPTSHWMRDLPLAYDVEKHSFYRTCEHRAAHQDPDERTRWTNILIREKNLRRRGKTFVTAKEKLEEWDCPDCHCLCCNLAAQIK